MQKKKIPVQPNEMPSPDEMPGIHPDAIPEIPQVPDEDPDIIPDEDPFETPPCEIPEPGEGP